MTDDERADRAYDPEVEWDADGVVVRPLQICVKRAAWAHTDLWAVCAECGISYYVARPHVCSVASASMHEKGREER